MRSCILHNFTEMSVYLTYIPSSMLLPASSILLLLLFCVFILCHTFSLCHIYFTTFKILLISCEDFLSLVYFTVFFCVVFFDAVVFAFAPSLTVSALVVVFAVDFDSAFRLCFSCFGFTGFADSVFLFCRLCRLCLSAFTGSAFAGSSLYRFLCS